MFWGYKRIWTVLYVTSRGESWSVGRSSGKLCVLHECLKRWLDDTESMFWAGRSGVQWALLLTSRTWLSTTTSSGPSAEYYTVDDKVFSDPGRLDVVARRVRWAACSRRGDGVLRGRSVARVDRECLHCGSSLPQNCRVKVRVSASMLAATHKQFISTTEHDIVVCTSQGNNNKLNKW